MKIVYEGKKIRSFDLGPDSRYLQTTALKTINGSFLPTFFVALICYLGREQSRTHWSVKLLLSFPPFT